MKTGQILLIGAVAYFGYRWWKNRNGSAPAVTTRPMQIAEPGISKEIIGQDDTFAVAKRELMQQGSCADRARGMEFADDNQKYEWIVSCSNQYAHASGW